MRKALALALTISLSFVGFPVESLVASGGQQSEPAAISSSGPLSFIRAALGFFAQNDIRDARRLGGRTTFIRPPLTTVESLHRMVARPGIQVDIRKILSDAGIPDTAEAVLRAMAGPLTPGAPRNCMDAPPADGSLAECEFQVGDIMEWMSLRPNAPKDMTAGIVRRVRWAGSAPFKAFLFRTTVNNKIYTFVIPKDCGNLALLSVADVPPPPPPPPPPVVVPPPPPPPPPTPAQAPAEVTQASNLTCVVKDAGQRNLANMGFRVRNAQGEIVATGKINAAGECVLPAPLPPGTYTVELIDEAGAIVGISPPTVVAAGAITVVAVALGSVSALAIAAGATGILAWLGTTAGVLTLVAAGGLAVAGTAAAVDDASPSR